MDLHRKMNFKKHVIIFDGILILGVLALTFSSSMRALAGFMISSVLIVVVSFIVRSWIRNNGSGDNLDDWKGYLVGVTAVSYTHLDVYKRQVIGNEYKLPAALFNFLEEFRRSGPQDIAQGHGSVNIK